MPFDIHSVYRLIFRHWRERRFKWFLQRLKPVSTDTLLDVGGFPGFWASHRHPLTRIDALNLHAVPWQAGDAPERHIAMVVGNGCSLTMPDQSYDIGYSNSVIEHVGSWECQRRFAAEIRRVARRLWVQTPAYECPFEPHYLAPFVHYLPRSIRKRVVSWLTPWGWLQRPGRSEVESMVDGIRLLRKSEMRKLFPDCEILTERFLWLFPKSYVALREKPPSVDRPVALLFPIAARQQHDLEPALSASRQRSEF